MLEQTKGRSDAGLPPAEEGKGSTSLLRVLHSLRRHWILFFAVWALTLLGGTAYSLTIKPVYRPQATLEVRPEMPLLSSEASDEASAADLAMWGNFYRTQEALLRSPSLIQDVLAMLPEPVSREYRQAADPVKAFLEKLDIEKTESSYILKVGFLHEDPDRAAEIVNTLVSLYLRDANRRLRTLKDDTLQVLSTEALPVIRERFDGADKALQSFHIATGFADFEEQYASLVDSRRKVETRLLEIRLRGFRIRSDVDALRGDGANGMSALYTEAFHTTRILDPLMARRVALASELAREKASLKDKHPLLRELEKELAAVDERIREVIQGALLSLQADLESLRGEEGALVAEASRVEKEMGGSRRRLTEFQRLRAERTTAQDLYNSYLKKQDETRATSDAGQAGVRVVDQATVTREPFRKSGWIVNLSLVLGLLLGILAVLLAEHVNDRIRSSREVEVYLGLDVLGEIPKLRGDGDGLLVLSDGSDPAELESFRALRARLMTGMDDAPGSRIILVTSAEPGEGKSTVAVNLARMLAMEGQRVLLFDAELRRPRMKSLLADSRGLGLEELLRGEASLPEAAQRSRIPGVDVLGADEGLLGAAEMAGSSRFRAALRAAPGSYDFIVIDSAPVNAISESALIARRADATLLVVRLGVTRRSLALAAQKKLADMKVQVLGAVVNGAQRSVAYHGYKNRRDLVREAERIAQEGDELVGIE